MENKKNIKIEPFPDMVATNVVTYGNEKDCIVVETVAGYANFFNWNNAPRYKTKEYKEEYIDYNGELKERKITENIRINYEFNEDPMLNLIFNQIVKIVINGELKEPRNKKDFAIFLTKFPDMMDKIVTDILTNSTFLKNKSDKGLAKKK